MGKLFTVTNKSSSGNARCGRLNTKHGSVDTPLFMPVGTRGTVKGIMPEQLRNIGAGMLLANAYHLMLRPGADVVDRLGGLHKFMAWDGPILTDSGGFQVFSLSKLNRIGKDEVEFASHIDGAKVRLGPRSATEAQNKLGADIIMAFDQCVALPCTREILAEAVERTIRWADQSLKTHRRDDQYMFGIVQGGTDKELRQYCSEKLMAMDFPGYAIGGLSVGESHEDMIETVKHTAKLLPENKPRYLMGVGTPRDIVAAIAAGVDMFDCVMPSRNGRNASAFTKNGGIKLRNEQYKYDTSPLDDTCDCYTCQNFSRGYIRHMFLVNEMAGPILVSMHNLAFYQKLMRQARDAIQQNRYDLWANQWEKYGIN